MEFANEYLKVVQERFWSVKDLGDKSLRQLSEGELHWKLNDTSNSIVIIVKHLNGNMNSRWINFLETDGEKETRNRDDEFTEEYFTKEELQAIWNNGWQTLFNTLKNLDQKDLLKKVTIRGEEHTVIEAIERQMAHYAYHVGQIVYIGKQVKNEDWTTLSIPKGQSEMYLQKQIEKHCPNNETPNR